MKYVMEALLKRKKKKKKKAAPFLDLVKTE